MRALSCCSSLLTAFLLWVPFSPHQPKRALTTYIGFLLPEVPPGSHASGMRLYDHHCPPFGLHLLAHKVAPAQRLQLDHPLPHGLVLLCQQLAPGNGLQPLKTQDDLWRQEGQTLKRRPGPSRVKGMEKAFPKGQTEREASHTPQETSQISFTVVCFLAKG